MATIYNSDLFKELKEGARIQQLTDPIPNQLQGNVIPVMEVNPKLLRRSNIIKNAGLTNGTTTTLYTTPLDKDFYIVAASLSVIKDVTSTSTDTSLRITVDNVVVRPLVISGITLTAQSQAVSISFSSPIKVDRNTAITINHATNVANIRGDATIIGYLVDNANA